MSALETNQSGRNYPGINRLYWRNSFHWLDKHPTRFHYFRVYNQIRPWIQILPGKNLHKWRQKTQKAHRSLRTLDESMMLGKLPTSVRSSSRTRTGAQNQNSSFAEHWNCVRHPIDGLFSNCSITFVPELLNDIENNRSSEETCRIIFFTFVHHGLLLCILLCPP